MKIREHLLSGKKGGEKEKRTLEGDYRTQYAKSGASKCRSCNEFISKVRWYFFAALIPFKGCRDEVKAL
jgi:hypothetical protein